MAYQSIHSGANVDAAITRALAGGAIDQEIALKAPIASPALTGTPTAPTQAAGDNSTKIATTEYADRAIMASLITESVGPSAVASFSDGADGVPIKSGTFQIVPAQSGSGTPAPDNVRPISGWTGCSIERASGNLFDKSSIIRDNYYLDSNGAAQNSAGWVISDYIPVIMGSYVGSSLANAVNVQSIAVYNASKQFVRTIPIVANGNTLVEIGEGEAFVRLSVRKSAGEINTAQFEAGTTPTAYKPYTGAPTIYNIDWTDEAGTVYGGTLEYKGGGAWRLTVDRIIYSLTGYESWSTSGSVGNGQRYICQRATYMPLADVSKTEISSHFLWRNSNYDWGAFRITSSNVLVYDASGHFTDHTEFALWLQGQVTAGTPVQFCVYTTSPQTYDLTGADVLTLLGSNAIWSDTGDAAVEYRADTKLYIDNAIASI